MRIDKKDFEKVYKTIDHIVNWDNKNLKNKTQYYPLCEVMEILDKIREEQQ